MKYKNLSRIYALLVAGVLVASAGIPIQAAYNRVYDLSARPNIVDKLVVAPGSVFFIGINPLRYPDWTMTVNDKLVVGPTPNLPAIFSGSSISSSDTDFNPLPVPSASPDSSGLAPMPSPSPPAPVVLGYCSFKDNAPFSATDDCTAQIDGHIGQVNMLVQDDQDKVVGIRHAYIALWNQAESLVHKAGIITDTASFNSYRDDVRTAIEVPRGHFIELATSLPTWPYGKVAEVNAELDALQAFYDARRVKGKGNLAAAQSEATYADDCKRLVDLEATIKTLKGRHIEPPAFMVSEQKSLKQRTTHAATVSKQALMEIDKIDTNVKKLQKKRARIAAYEAKSDLAAAYERLRLNLYEIAQKRVAPATPDRFGFADTEECRGLNTGKREKTYILALGDGRGAQVRVLCQSRMFLSAGVSFSGLAQPTYTTVPVEPTPIPASTPLPTGSPLAGAPAPVRIVAQTYNRIRATGVVLNNVRLSEPNGENGLYASFGAAITSGNSGNTNLDYVGGLSWSISRAMLVTLGIQYGALQELPAGYKEGDLVPAGTNPPNTVTRNASKFFIGITFGQQ